MFPDRKIEDARDVVRKVDPTSQGREVEFADPVKFLSIVSFSELPETPVLQSQLALTTQDVLNASRLRMRNTSPVTITNLLSGQEGQQVSILGDGFTTLAHNSNIRLNTGANKLLAANQVYILTRMNSQWVEVASGGGVTHTGAFLSSTQANSTITPAVLTGASFTIPPGKTGTFTAIVIFTAAATTTGIGCGFRVAQGSGASANARGSWLGYGNLNAAAAATGLSDGDAYNVAASANTYGELLTTGTTAGNNSVLVSAVITNPSTNANTTVTFEFRSEVATSAVTLQIGSGVTAVIG